ncbi:MAG: AAA family ATPase [Planctomycetota bacterium]|nr:AAA family ATPase [Planctomycetota bacterium]
MCKLTELRRVLAAADLRQGLALDEVEAHLTQFARLNDAGQRGLAFYLVEMEDRRLWQETAHACTRDYAEDRLGLDRRRVGELITVGRKLLELPAIDRAFCEQRLSWSKLVLLMRVVVPEHEAAWLERALASTVKKLKLDVKLATPGTAPRPEGSTRGLPEPRFPVAVDLDPITYGKLEAARKKLATECDRSIDYVELFAELAGIFLNLEADGTVPGRKRVNSSHFRVVLKEGEDGGLYMDSDLGPIPIVRADDPLRDADETNDDPTPSAMRTRVLMRDGGRCRCCGASKDLMVHHIQYRSEGGPTVTWNLITLCTRCHSHVHAGRLILVGTRAEAIRFTDMKGRPVYEPGSEPSPELCMPMAPPEIAPAEPTQPAAPRVPATIDRSWWRRHAHRIKYRREQGFLLRPGASMRDLAPDAPKPEPVSPEEAFRGLVAQDAMLARLGRRAAGRRARGEAFPHTLLYGPPGTGKTSLAKGMARCFGTRLHRTTGPMLKDIGALVILLAGLREGDMLFIDEVHGAQPAVLETLYEAMAERQLSLTVETEGVVHTTTLELPRFTVLAATTEEGDLTEAFRSRFAARESLGHYAEADLAAIVRASARGRGFEVTAEAAHRLAQHARGTPREALRLMECALDDVAGVGIRRIEEGHVRTTLGQMGYDGNGLDPSEQRYLAALRSCPDPVPATRLARMLGTSVRTLVDIVEPFLFRKGLVRMTPRGRVAVPDLPDVRRPALRPAIE